jgi:hypothetical protein
VSGAAQPHERMRQKVKHVRECAGGVAGGAGAWCSGAVGCHSELRAQRLAGRDSSDAQPPPQPVAHSRLDGMTSPCRASAAWENQGMTTPSSAASAMP